MAQWLTLSQNNLYEKSYCSVKLHEAWIAPIHQSQYKLTYTQADRQVRKDTYKLNVNSQSSSSKLASVIETINCKLKQNFTKFHAIYTIRATLVNLFLNS